MMTSLTKEELSNEKDIFLPYTTEIDGGNYLDGWVFELYRVIDKFIAVAMVEEGFKWLVLLGFTKKNKHLLERIHSYKNKKN